MVPEFPQMNRNPFRPCLKAVPSMDHSFTQNHVSKIKTMAALLHRFCARPQHFHQMIAYRALDLRYWSHSVCADDDEESHEWWIRLIWISFQSVIRWTLCTSLGSTNQSSSTLTYSFRSLPSSTNSCTTVRRTTQQVRLKFFACYGNRPKQIA